MIPKYNRSFGCLVNYNNKYIEFIIYNTYPIKAQNLVQIQDITLVLVLDR